MGLLRACAEIFSTEKHFATPWVGHPGLNRLGLHGARIALSDAALQLRRLQVKAAGAPSELAQFEAEGVLVIPDLLPKQQFAAVREEARRLVAQAAARHPTPSQATSRGFGPKLPFAGGFDRFDGDTLNRFIDLSPEATPQLMACVASERLARVCSAASGFNHQPRRFSLYLTVAGDAHRNPDPQCTLHRDTFHSAIKLWLFLEDVEEADGPFQYVARSHRMTAARYRWELARARAAAAPGVGGGGSFRIDAQELSGLGLAQPSSYPVRANTLVIADVRGFHRRGLARLGATRLALYANLRTMPFSPVVY
jgi:hypothetical protein